MFSSNPTVATGCHTVCYTTPMPAPDEMYEGQRTRVFVIGAGIAGLTAADMLRNAGMAVTVFESAGDVGGRIRSIRFHDHDIECGAQFLLSGYRYVLPLLRRYELGLRLREFTRRTALERGGRLHRVDFRRPWSLASSGLLSWRESARMTIGGAPLAWHGRAINPSHYASLSNLDDIEADHFCQQKLDVAASRHVVEAMVHGFFFHGLSGSSRALIAAMMKFGADQALTIMGGWQALRVPWLPGSSFTHGRRLKRCLNSQTTWKCA